MLFLQNTQSIYEVRAMPTFLFIRNRQTIHKIQGANANELRSKVQELSSSGGPDSASSEGIGVPGMVKLLMCYTLSYVN